MWAGAFLRNDPERPGAAQLRRVRKLKNLAINSIQSGDTLTAAWAAMHALDALWLAQTFDGYKMTVAGVKSTRAYQKANDEKARIAEEKHAGWQAHADKVWARRPTLSESAVAKIIAAETKESHNTIRQSIRKPGKKS
jgi:hypothetical protein